MNMEISALQVSCTLLQGFNADSSFFGLTEHSWTFYTTIGRDGNFLCYYRFAVMLISNNNNQCRRGCVQHQRRNIVQPKDKHAL